MYIEEGAASYPMTELLTRRFPNARRILTRHYQDVFNRPNQNFQLQKGSMKLILAVKEDNLLYEGSDFSQSMGHTHFYYNSLILNCVYNCDYCYLQGMYRSGNIVIFVNFTDFCDAVQEKLNRHPVYLAVSYDTDLLGFENVVPYCAEWIEFARTQKNLTVEIRTKSANYKSISHLKASPNVILAWTISPTTIAEKYEKGTSAPERRVDNALRAIRDGWKVRLCFDPMILVESYRKIYSEMIEMVFNKISPEKIHDVSVGVFRMNAEYLKRIKKQRNGPDILFYPFETKEGAASYAEGDSREAVEFVRNVLLAHLPKEKIFI